MEEPGRRGCMLETSIAYFDVRRGDLAVNTAVNISLIEPPMNDGERHLMRRLLKSPLLV